VISEKTGVELVPEHEFVEKTLEGRRVGSSEKRIFVTSVGSGHV
jgi:hypothetical protein